MTANHASASAATAAAIEFSVAVADVNAHLFAVTLTIAQPAAIQRLSLPVWIPGSYLVREFSRHLQNLQAFQAGQRLPVRQLSKNTWEVAADSAQPLRLQYQVYAFDVSVRTAWLDAWRGFFNGTSLFLRVHDQQDRPHRLHLNATDLIAGCAVATALEPENIDKNGFGTYGAADYHALVDAPVEWGHFWSGQCSTRGVEHRLVLSGAAPTCDSERLLADTRTLCQAVIDFWHPAAAAGGDPNDQPPLSRYLFLLNAIDDGYGGLEHSHSSALICRRRDLPVRGQTHAPEGYTTLLGLISHEYFHAWNVKRLRPFELTQYDYEQENYTELLWFFEGFTSYYDDLLLRRAGLLDDAAYLALLSRAINQVLQSPGRQLQSVAQSSFDAWVKYYRSDENTPNATVSYYAKGALVALCFDLTLRQEGHSTLDAVLRRLWQRCQAGPLRQADFAAVLAELGARSFEAEIDAWVHGTAELPLASLLAGHGVDWQSEPAPLAQQLGLRASESQGVRITGVLRGSVAEQAGFAAGDEWLGIEQSQPDGTLPTGWRLRRLDELPAQVDPALALTALVARDQRLLRLRLAWPVSGLRCKLVVSDPERAQGWLSGRSV